jgi:hypothetical protein
LPRTQRGWSNAFLRPLADEDPTDSKKGGVSAALFYLPEAET